MAKAPTLEDCMRSLTAEWQAVWQAVSQQAGMLAPAVEPAPAPQPTAGDRCEAWLADRGAALCHMLQGGFDWFIDRAQWVCYHPLTSAATLTLLGLVVAVGAALVALLGG